MYNDLHQLVSQASRKILERSFFAHVLQVELSQILKSVHIGMPGHLALLQCQESDDLITSFHQLQHTTPPTLSFTHQQKRCIDKHFLLQTFGHPEDLLVLSNPSICLIRVSLPVELGWIMLHKIIQTDMILRHLNFILLFHHVDHLFDGPSNLTI